MITWTEEFETGFATIDQQHRWLIEKTNRLEELLHITNPNRQQAEFALNLVDALEDYAYAHFSGEEHCMESYNCPAHAQNRQEHERFRGVMRNFKRQCEKQGFQVELLRKLHKTVESWIQKHILKIDTRLKACVQK